MPTQRLSLDIYQVVDATTNAAVAAGGSAETGPLQIYGLRCRRSVADPDHHIRGFVWRDGRVADQGAAAIDVTVPQEA